MELFVAFLSMLLVVALVPLYLWKRRQVSQSVDDEREPLVHQPETVVRHPTRRMRRRPAAGASTSAAPTFEENGEDSDENDDSMADYQMPKGSKKKEKKRQEREAQRQAVEAARDSRQFKQDHYAEMRRKKDEEREAEDRLMEEKAREKQAKEEETAALEFEKWKGEFSVDAEGTTENEVQDEGQGLLFDFIEYIKKHKCVPLEDLAAEFKLRTQECINRINSLESMGRLSGVMDDRGKYIYISMEEMEAVADYIKRQGRVSIAHLASCSNQFIDLEPKSQVVDESSLAEAITAN